MSINIHRTPRKTEFWKDKTPAILGPGKYFSNENEQKSGTECLAPFSTLKERTLHKVNDNPGPGAYLNVSNDKLNRNHDQRSFAFRSTASRFAPQAPGCTVFKEPSSIDNPGPGFYYKTDYKKKENKTTVKKSIGKVHKELAHKLLPPGLKNRVISIPGRKIPLKGFEGFRGPGTYHPTFAVIEQRCKSSDFSKSNQQRNIFTPSINIDNKLPPKNFPGPGEYDNLGAKNQPKTTLFNVAGHSSFVSRVPNCKKSLKQSKTPGPGSYDQPSSLSIQRSSSTEPKQETFISNTKRENFWSHDPDTPYTEPFKNKVPGPGKYDLEKNTKDNFKTFHIEVVSAPFNSTEERMPGGKSQTPGPGQYIDIENPIHSSVTKGILKFATDRGIMEAQGIASATFGSSQTRFKHGMFHSKEGPGPGAYHNENEDITKELMMSVKNGRPGTHIGFCSKVERFEPNQEISKPEMHLLSSKPSPPTPSQPPSTHPTKPTMQGSYNQIKSKLASMHEISNTLNRPKWGNHSRALSYNRIHEHKIGFDSTNARFHYQKPILSSNKQTGNLPGPGSYSFTHGNTACAVSSSDRNRNKKAHAQSFYLTAKDRPSSVTGIVCLSAFNSSEHKFGNKVSSYRPTTGTSSNLGPGAYAKESSMIKKSYNLTMEHSFLV